MMRALAFAAPTLLAGMAIGVMLMAVLQRYARQRLAQKPIAPRRWNGRYPGDRQ